MVMPGGTHEALIRLRGSAHRYEVIAAELTGKEFIY